MIGGVILQSAGRHYFFRDVKGATGQGASLASASGPPLQLLTAGRRLCPSLHLWQRAAAALTEALARKIKKGRIRNRYTDLWIRNLYD